MRTNLFLNARGQRRGGLAQPGGVERQQERCHRRTFGKMQPHQIILMSRRPRRWHKAALPVFADDPVGDGAAFKDDLAIGFDHRALAQRMHGLQFRRRQIGHGVAIVMLDLVGRSQFFQQPQDALRAAVVEMVNNDHGNSLRNRIGLGAHHGDNHPGRRTD